MSPLGAEMQKDDPSRIVTAPATPPAAVSAFQPLTGPPPVQPPRRRHAGEPCGVLFIILADPRSGQPEVGWPQLTPGRTRTRHDDCEKARMSGQTQQDSDTQPLT